MTTAELEGKSLQYHEERRPETEREFDEGDRTAGAST